MLAAFALAAVVVVSLAIVSVGREYRSSTSQSRIIMQNFSGPVVADVVPKNSKVTLFPWQSSSVLCVADVVTKNSTVKGDPHIHIPRQSSSVPQRQVHNAFSE